ncbi:hypothetical protein ABZP36_014371 [Zizania latifolia]
MVWFTAVGEQIESDVERQGDFIRFLIKEVEGAAFVDIEDVVTFVKWLDVELTWLVSYPLPACHSFSR